MEGRIHSLKRDKGFGFITDAEGQARFFHANSVDDGVDFKTLREGQKVRFEPYEEPGKGNGLRATAVAPQAA